MKGLRVKSKILSSAGPWQLFIEDTAVSVGWLLVYFPGRFKQEGLAV
jgi:hypothetical protein